MSLIVESRTYSAFSQLFAIKETSKAVFLKVNSAAESVLKNYGPILEGMYVGTVGFHIGRIVSNLLEQIPTLSTFLRDIPRLEIRLKNVSLTRIAFVDPIWKGIVFQGIIQDFLTKKLEPIFSNQEVSFGVVS